MKKKNFDNIDLLLSCIAVGLVIFWLYSMISVDTSEIEIMNNSLKEYNLSYKKAVQNE